MKDERIIVIREKVHKEFALAEDNLESAVVLYEAEKYRASIPLFRDSILSGTKALLMLSLDDLPDDSLLVDSYYQTEISKEIKLGIGLNEVLTKLRNVEQDSIEHPLSISKESFKNLDICYKQTENFLGKARKVIKKSLITTKEIKKRKFILKLIATTSAGIVTIFVLVKIILWLLMLGKGLSGEYFAGQNFEKLIKTRIDKKIDFNWVLGRIVKNYSDNVSVRWNGKIKAPRSGEYKFITRSDDGVRVWIDDKLIIDVWRILAPEENRARINLDKGYHRIKVEYFEKGGDAFVKLMWIIPGKQKQKVISPSYLKPM